MSVTSIVTATDVERIAKEIVRSTLAEQSEASSLDAIADDIDRLLGEMTDMPPTWKVTRADGFAAVAYLDASWRPCVGVSLFGPSQFVKTTSTCTMRAAVTELRAMLSNLHAARNA